ncbi:hypothetical protein EJB05_08848, partial [Eragrostis curvula]
MEASQRPRTRTESECTSRTAQATHSFTISRYSLLKRLGRGQFIRSANFTVRGYDWCIRYYPNGDSEEHRPHISFPRASDQGHRGGLSTSVFCDKTGKLFKSKASENPSWGLNLMNISELEASQYLRGDCLVIECDITVILGEPVLESKTSCDIPELLEAGERTDVTFEVEGESFRAHRIVLAMRSPVFNLKRNSMDRLGRITGIA